VWGNQNFKNEQLDIAWGMLLHGDARSGRVIATRERGFEEEGSQAPDPGGRVQKILQSWRERCRKMGAESR